MQTVYIGSPSTSPAEFEYMLACVRDCLSRGEAPFTAALYAKSLTDHRDAGRLIAENARHVHLAGCNVIAFYTDLGWTDEMRKDFALAKSFDLFTEERYFIGPGAGVEREMPKMSRVQRLAW